MANKYGQSLNFTKCRCANCPYSNNNDQNYEGNIYCKEERQYVDPTWVCCNHPDMNR